MTSRTLAFVHECNCVRALLLLPPPLGGVLARIRARRWRLENNMKNNLCAFLLLLPPPPPLPPPLVLLREKSVFCVIIALVLLGTCTALASSSP